MRARKTRDRLRESIGRIHHADREIVAECLAEIDKLENLAEKSISEDSVVLKLMESFPGSFINHHGEFIAHKEANNYFNLRNCSGSLEIHCKVLERISRPAFKEQPFRSKTKNRAFNDFMLRGINNFLGTKFDETDIETIYQELGNEVDRNLTIKFIENHYDMAVLEGE